MKKNIKFTAGTIVNILLVTLIFIIITAFSMEHHKRYDLTTEKRFSLDDKSIKVVENLKKDVDVIVFYSRGGNFLERARNILDQYTYHTKKMHVTYLETNKNPLKAKEMELKSADSLVLKTDKKREILTELNEETVTNTLIKVTQDKQVYVGFASGHGERDIKNTEGSGYATAAKSLESENYRIESINIASEKGIPEDLELLIISGPKTEYLDTEIEKIKQYVEKGKSIMVMLEPSKNAGDTKLVELLKSWGVEARDEVVIDQLGVQFYRNPFVAVVPANFYGNHEIVKNFNIQTFYLLARPLVLIMPPPENTGFDALASTAPAPVSFAKKIQANLTEKDIEFVKDKDMPGPIRIAVAGTIKNPKGVDAKGAPIVARAVVFGNVNFACNEFLNIQGNKNIFMNSISWLTQQEELISIRKAQAKFAPLFMDEKQKSLIQNTVVFVLPGVIILAGIVMLWRKR